MECSEGQGGTNTSRVNLAGGGSLFCCESYSRMVVNISEY